jgi:putative restriction endonuclease
MALPNWAARPEERTLLEGETLYQGVRRVVDAWRERNDDTATTFVRDLKERFPKPLQSIDDSALGVLCGLVWMYIGGKPGVQAKTFMKWWDEAIPTIAPSRTGASDAHQEHILGARFDDTPSNASRALQIWLILLSKAHNRQTITYGQLAQLLGFRGAGTLNHPLGHIMYYCIQQALPPLTVLVVNQDTGLPGDGLVGAKLNADREAVFEFSWFDLVPPTIEQLGRAYATHASV